MAYEKIKIMVKVAAKMYGISVMLMAVLLMAHIFLVAYTSDYTAKIDINRYGEANVELIMFIMVGVPLAVYTWRDYIHKIR